MRYFDNVPRLAFSGDNAMALMAIKALVPWLK